jgi:hypothetical protein
MRTMPRLAVLTSLALAILAGCTSPRDVVTATPTVDELPDLSEAEGTFPVDVGVQGASDRPRIVLVAPMPEPELTPEERQILGLDQDQGYDPLELYRPPIGAAQGVDPSAVGLLSGVGGGWGGSSVGLVLYPPLMGVGSDWAGAATGTSTHPVSGASGGAPKPQPAAVGPRSVTGVGNSGPAKRLASPERRGGR